MDFKRIMTEKDNERAIYNTLPAWEERGHRQHHLMHNLPTWRKKKERIIKKGQYMQTLHILPALRKKLQDSDGTFNLRKERKKGGKKKNSSVLLPA